MNVGNRLIERRLSKTGTRLKSLRAELEVIDEQIRHLGDDAEDQAIRALVSETPGAGAEARDAQRHVDAMRKHREHVLTEIGELQTRQDELLDQLTTSR
ncbi:hypothetical protein YM304_21360 [Ilumatobacter coccineus YM16-304]|uniref:Uncharacterized protein n=1 Tax=Ilumatobacter coccineus (strain NBRC 103263 / KCTC 29153 / YM16-304) TaxID=1313172 RepID=A0A6C7E7P3_ILUCY|nr:hypothetical protein YM304_21360 [Ilumatobacter coccineus YM16-304]